MEILTIISKILDLKLVQWLLLATVIILTATAIVDWFRYTTLRAEYAFVESKLAENASALKIQNEAVKRMAEQADLQEKVMQQAVNKASKIAVENKKVLDGITDYKLKGVTCDDKVRSAFTLISTSKRVH